MGFLLCTTEHRNFELIIFSVLLRIMCDLSPFLNAQERSELIAFRAQLKAAEPSCPVPLVETNCFFSFDCSYPSPRYLAGSLSIYHEIQSLGVGHGDHCYAAIWAASQGSGSRCATTRFCLRGREGFGADLGLTQSWGNW